MGERACGVPKLSYKPASWLLDYVLVYLWDRTDQTPEWLCTPADVYRQAVEGA